VARLGLATAATGSRVRVRGKAKGGAGGTLNRGARAPWRAGPRERGGGSERRIGLNPGSDAVRQEARGRE
jgi:hypothetical protein